MIRSAYDVKTNSLKAKLTLAGIALNAPTLPESLETPWFVRVLQAFSGWLAALFLLGFIAIGGVFIVESAAASLGLGLALIGAAFALLRAARSDVLEHLALAISLAGQLLVGWAAVEYGNNAAYVWWSMLVLQSALALVMPSVTHRGFSAFAASVALYMAWVTAAMGMVASGIVLCALTALWLNEFRWPRRIKEIHAWGYGLALGLLVTQGLAHAGHPLPFLYDVLDSSLIRLGIWLSVGLVALAQLILFQALFQKQTLASARWAAYAAGAVLLVVTFYIPSVGQGVVVVLLGFAIGNRVLTGLGMLSLILAIGSYYYWLNATFLTKSIALLVMGLLLLGLRFGLRRCWKARITRSNNRSVDNDA
ncbi:DUF4401 domain-containing protein [Vreelandella profundi]|uniref:DUF4401 domain-containing protein n=1 Tax=Vreelandella profundi TaxID=2852117 RepID=UPI001EF03DEB|nr:DUF4401 domain-containing protein [Halomonas profundi]